MSRALSPPPLQPLPPGTSVISRPPCSLSPLAPSLGDRTDLSAHPRRPSLDLCRWWDRDFTDETNDPKNVYDKGGPDYMADYPTYERFGITYQNCEKNLKWRIVCAGVQRLCEEQGLNEEDVALWVDWQSSTPHRSSNPPD